MTSRTLTRAAFLVAALALAGCGDGDVRIKIDASRSVLADTLEIYFCSPSGSCELGSDPFDDNTDLSNTVQVHVPSGHTPVPLAFVYDDSDPQARACQTASINLSPDTVEINVAVGGDPTLVIACPDGVCSDETTPADCSSL